MSWIHVVHAYWWLENNNFWKSVVAFWVTLGLGAVLTAFLRPMRKWKKHRELQQRAAELQQKIADHLDTSTPGGLTDLVSALQTLTEDLSQGEAPDDNGTDLVDDDEIRKRSPSHSGRIEPGHNVIPNARGGNSASHR